MVISHGPLWVDAEGKLCEEPPASGRKLAAAEGVVIDGELASMFGLSVEGGKVMQRNSDVSKTQDAEGHTVAASAAGAAVAPDSDKPKPQPKVAKNSAATAGGAKKPAAKRTAAKPASAGGSAAKPAGKA